MGALSSSSRSPARKNSRQMTAAGEGLVLVSPKRLEPKEGNQIENGKPIEGQCFMMSIGSHLT